MYQLLKRSNLFSFSTIQEILKGHGIINHNIVRNLTLFPFYSVSPSSMKVDSVSPLQIQIRNPIRSQTLALSSLSQALKLGNYNII